MHILKRALNNRVSIETVILTIAFISLFSVNLIAQTNQGSNPSAAKSNKIPCVHPIFDEAKRNFGKNDYKTAASLGAESARLECENDLQFKQLVNWWTFRAYSFSKQSREALIYLQKAILLGFTGFADLKHNPNYVFLHRNPKWMLLINSSKENFVRLEVAAGNNPQVNMLVQEDQEERKYLFNSNQIDLSSFALNWNRMTINDRNRQKIVRILVTKGKLKTKKDIWSAAFILQHSGELDDIKTANNLVKNSIENGDEKQKCSMGLLFAETTDRLLWYMGKPQIYGTQSRPNSLSFPQTLILTRKIATMVRKGKYVPAKVLTVLLETNITPEPFDKTLVSDKERRQLCLSSSSNS